MKMNLISMKINAGETHFQVNSFARSLVLAQRQKVLRQWPVEGLNCCRNCGEKKRPNKEVVYLQAMFLLVKFPDHEI